MTPAEEQLVQCVGERSGLPLAIAVDSTALGPALGGCRMWHYESSEDGVTDARRLAAAMTLKAAAAGLDLGGGKGVICLNGSPPFPGQRRAALLDFADAVEALGGSYITAEDVGTSAEDMAVISTRTSHVVGMPARLGGHGDPSPLTARGVEHAIRACCAHRFGTSDLDGVRVCVVGLGHVGASLATRLAEAGAELYACDIDSSKRPVAEEMGAQWVDPEAAMLCRCEVLAPCALGGGVDEGNAELMRCEVICGAANNVLADESLAETLRQRQITYAPDFIANAGGLIHVYADLLDRDQSDVDELVAAIGDTTASVLADSEELEITPLEAARRVARRRLRPSSLTPAA